MKNKYGKDIETFAQKIAQEEDAGTFNFKIFNDGTGKPTEIVKKELSTSEVLRQGFDEEQAARKKEEEDEEEDTSKFLDDVANNTPNTKMFDHLEDESKNEVIDINNYERYWDNSTPNGHQIRILKQDNSTLTINMEWPKGYNPRLREVKKR
jgi:hypothetical protein